MPTPPPPPPPPKEAYNCGGSKQSGLEQPLTASSGPGSRLQESQSLNYFQVYDPFKITALNSALSYTHSAPTAFRDSHKGESHGTQEFSYAPCIICFIGNEEALAQVIQRSTSTHTHTQAHIHTHTHNWLKKGGAMGRPTQNNPLKAQGGGFSST